MMITFHIIREARLRLTHQRHEGTEGKGPPSGEAGYGKSLIADGCLKLDDGFSRGNFLRMRYKIQLWETDEGWSVSCPDLKGCHSQGISRDDAIQNIAEAIRLWLEVEADENGIKSVETTEIAL